MEEATSIVAHNSIRKKSSLEKTKYSFFKQYLRHLTMAQLREMYQHAVYRTQKDLEEAVCMRDDAFFKSLVWKKLRVRILNMRGRKCDFCGKTSKETILHVDHKRPRWIYPELSLEIDNLRVLCEECNLGKGTKVPYHKNDWNRFVVKRIKK